MPPRSRWPMVVAHGIALGVSGAIYSFVPESREFIPVLFGAAMYGILGQFKR